MLGTIAALIVVCVLLGLALARTVDERDEWQRRSQAYHIDAQEARQIVITSRAALTRAQKEIEAAQKREEEAQAKIKDIRRKLSAAALDKQARSDLWNAED